MNKKSRLEQITIINKHIVTSREAQEILGITRSRLSQLVHKKKLVPIKKNIFLLTDVLYRKIEQEKLRAIYYKSKNNRKNK